MELDPDYFVPHFILGRSYVRLGKAAEAIAELKHKAASAEESPLMAAALGLAYGTAGQTKNTQKIVQAFAAQAKKRYIPETYFGMLYAGLGDQEQALNWLEKAYAERADGLTWINVEPMFDGLRQHPRFQILVKRMGLLGNEPMRP